MEIKRIDLESIMLYIPLTKKEGMAGFSDKAVYYGAFVGEVLVGFTSIQYYSNKAKFNNHYIFKSHRGKGYFKRLLDFSIQEAKSVGCNTIVAACTQMSLAEYIKRGATIEKVYKICTNIKMII